MKGIEKQTSFKTRPIPDDVKKISFDDNLAVKSWMFLNFHLSQSLVRLSNKMLSYDDIFNNKQILALKFMRKHYYFFILLIIGVTLSRQSQEWGSNEEEKKLKVQHSTFRKVIALRWNNIQFPWLMKFVNNISQSQQLIPRLIDD